MRSRARAHCERRARAPRPARRACQRPAAGAFRRCVRACSLGRRGALRAPRRPRRSGGTRRASGRRPSPPGPRSSVPPRGGTETRPSRAPRSHRPRGSSRACARSITPRVPDRAASSTARCAPVRGASTSASSSPTRSAISSVERPVARRTCRTRSASRSMPTEYHGGGRVPMLAERAGADGEPARGPASLAPLRPASTNEAFSLDEHERRTPVGAAKPRTPL